MNRAKVKLLAGTALAVMFTVAGTVAYGFWSSSGSGAGTGRAAPLVVGVGTPTEASGTALVPGVAGDLVLAITNDNPFPIDITVTLDPAASGVVTPSVPRCDVAVDLASAQFPIRIEAHRTSTTVTLSGAATLDAQAPSDCQGATFTIPVVVTAEVVL